MSSIKQVAIVLDTPKQYVEWQENNVTHKVRWLSQSNYQPPTRIVTVDDTTTADEAYRLANAGTSMLWQGDFHNGRQLLQALTRRIDRSEQRKANKIAKTAAKKVDRNISNPAIENPPTSFRSSSRSSSTALPAATPNVFHQHRQIQAQRARLLSRLLLQFTADYVIPLRRAPDVSHACTAAFGTIDEPSMLSYRDLQGVLGAAQWRKKGVAITGLHAEQILKIHPHYGVFAPTRHEYVPLMLEAPLPAQHKIAYDIGTGTGLLAIILAQRGVEQVIATDLNPRAIACALDNVERIGLSNIDVQQTDLFPIDAPPAHLIVCNPPWLPAKPSSPLEYAVYDPNSTMLRGFLMGVKQHLAALGEVWLILSDLAEHLQLRSRQDLLGWFNEAGLQVKYRLDTTPKHGRSQDASDPLYAARSREVTSLWCLH